MNTSEMTLSTWTERGRLRWILLAVFLAAVPLLQYLKVPCTARSGMVLRATLLGSLAFLLTLPAAWFICRRLFGRLLGTGLLVTYGLVMLFPARLLSASGVNHCRLVPAQPTTVFGFGGVVILILFLGLGLLSTYLLHREKLSGFLGRLPWRKGIVYGALLVLAVTQVAIRYGSSSPKSVSGGWHHKDRAGYPHKVFHGVRYGGGDHELHIHTSGMFRGVGTPKTYDKLLINRRAMGPFLYTQVSAYLSPYAAAIAVNLLFYLLILIGGYLLARELRLSEWVSVGFAVLLSANHFLLWRTVTPYFYLPFDAAILLVLYGLLKLRPFDRPASVATLLQFGSLLALAALSYDPMVLCAALILWTLLRAYRTDEGFQLRAAGIGLGLSLVPVAVQQAWEAMLRGLSLAGSPTDAAHRALFFKKVVALPGFLVDEPWECLRIVDTAVTRLVLTNRTDTFIVEYWATLGLLGVISLFALLPRFAERKGLRDLIACFFASVLVGVLLSLTAAIPPRAKMDIFALDPMRTTSAAYPAVLLGQAVGLHFLAGKVGFGSTRARDIIFLVLVGILWVLSFGKLVLT